MKSIKKFIYRLCLAAFRNAYKRGDITPHDMQRVERNLLGKLAGLGLVMVLLSSCVTSKKVNRYLEKHPEEFARICSENFPVIDSIIVRDSIRFDTLYLETEGEVIKDSFYLKADTIIRVVTKQCPPHKTVIKTVTKDSIIIRRDRAFETVQKNLLIELRDQLVKAEKIILDQQDKIKKRTNRMWLFFWIALALAVWTVRKPLIGVAGKLINPLKTFYPF